MTRIARAECEDGAIYIYPEEGTRIARAECEDGAISIYPEEGTRIARAECEDGAISIYHIGRKGPVLHGRSAKTVL